MPTCQMVGSLEIKIRDKLASCHSHSRSFLRVSVCNSYSHECISLGFWVEMRLRNCSIAITAAVVCLLNLQRLATQITLRNLMFLCERIIEDFAQESENLSSYFSPPFF